MKPFTVFLSAILLLALPVVALESRVITVSEKILSMDLAPLFEIMKSDLDTSDEGMVSQDFIINNTAAAGSAYISVVISVYDEIMSKISSTTLSELFLVGGITKVQSRGHKEIANWTAINKLGRNVTVHMFASQNQSPEVDGGSYDMAVWDIETHLYHYGIDVRSGEYHSIDQNPYP